MGKRNITNETCNITCTYLRLMDGPTYGVPVLEIVGGVVDVEVGGVIDIEGVDEINSISRIEPTTTTR